MKTFRVYHAITDETILFIKMENLFKASYWVFKNYGDDSDVDIEEAKGE